MADEYVKLDDVLQLLNRNSITKTITFSDGISIDLHEKAVYSRNKGIDSYIPLKVVDAIINNYLRDLEEKKHSE